jgi:hypothetical protein
MSEYQYYEFLALDRPLTAAEQAEIRELSTRARITATSFTNEYEWGDFKGSPDLLMQRYYDAHLYLANWGTHRIMLRLPRTLLDPETADRYCADGRVSVLATRDHVILDLTSEDEAGDWEEGAEDSLSAIVGVRSELAAGDLRALYLAWLSAYSGWEGGDEGDQKLEPPVPAGLGALTAAQRALADFLRVDPCLLQAAAEASPALPEVTDARLLAAYVRELSARDKDRLLMLVVQNQAGRARMELLRGMRTEPDEGLGIRLRRTVAELLDTAAGLRAERDRQAAAEAAAHKALREQQRAAARQRHLDELARDPEAAWAKAKKLISTKVPARYDEAVTLVLNLRDLAWRDGQVSEFQQRFAALRDEHTRKPSLIARFTQAGLTA